MPSTQPRAAEPGPIGGALAGAARQFLSMPAAWRVASLVLFFGAWEIAGRTNFNWAFPTFFETAAAMGEMIADGSMAAAYLRTIEPLAIGLAISLVVGVGAGVAMGLRRDVEWLSLPIFITMQAAPMAALIPLVTFVYGIGLTSKVLAVIMLALPVIAMNSFKAVRNVSPSLVDMCRSFMGSRRQQIVKVILPAASPMMFAGIRLGVAEGFSGVVLAELLITPTGIGDLITYNRSVAKFDAMYAAIVSIVLFAVIAVTLLDRLETAPLPSRDRERAMKLEARASALPRGAADEAIIAVRGIEMVYGGALTALKDIDLDFERGALTCLLGPSGCGKTTLLKIIAGLLRPTAGEVRVDGRPVTGPGPERAFVFQDFALLPWASVLRNAAFGLEMQGVAEGRARGAGAPAHRPGRARRLRGEVSARALGRHAAAGRARPRARGRRRRAADGRAVLGGRRADPPQVPGGHDQAARGREEDLRAGHPFDRGGGLPLGPHRPLVAAAGAGLEGRRSAHPARRRPRGDPARPGLPRPRRRHLARPAPLRGVRR